MIYYFSATGNTGWAAKRLAEETGDKLVFIPDVMGQPCRCELREDESLGLVFPVHGWRPPQLIRHFVGSLQVKPFAGRRPYVYMLVTAGDSIGQTTELLAKDLRQRGLQLDAAFSLIMPEAYVGLPFMDVDTAERERQKKTKAEKDLQEIITNIEDRRAVTKTVKGPLPRFFSGPVGGFFVHHLVTDHPFHVEEDRCVKCGICADVCPVDNIDGGLGKQPRWKHTGDCLSCFACYHHCPHHAIEYGRRTQHKGQYFFNRNKLK